MLATRSRVRTWGRFSGSDENASRATEERAGIKDVNYIPGQHDSGGCGLHTRMSEK
jgi:hypothetical protein